MLYCFCLRADCRCGDKAPPAGTNKKLSNCNAKCTGGPTEPGDPSSPGEACGSKSVSTTAKTYTTLYLMDAFPDPIDISPGSFTGAQHKGCFSVMGVFAFPAMPTFTDTDMNNEVIY